MNDLGLDMDIYNKNLKGVVESNNFLGLYSQSALKDPGCMMSLGAAIMLDKPIHIIVFPNVVIPEKLKKVADSIYYAVEGELEDDLESVVKKVVKGFIK